MGFMDKDKPTLGEEAGVTEICSSSFASSIGGRESTTAFQSQEFPMT
jgi:hypothetical protein